MVRIRDGFNKHPQGTPENCHDGNFYVMYILPQPKKLKVLGVGSQGVAEGQAHQWGQKPTLSTLGKEGTEARRSTMQRLML